MSESQDIFVLGALVTQQLSVDATSKVHAELEHHDGYDYTMKIVYEGHNFSIPLILPEDGKFKSKGRKDEHDVESLANWIVEAVKAHQKSDNPMAMRSLETTIY